MLFLYEYDIEDDLEISEQKTSFDAQQNYITEDADLIQLLANQTPNSIENDPPIDIIT